MYCGGQWKNSWHHHPQSPITEYIFRFLKIIWYLSYWRVNSMWPSIYVDIDLSPRCFRLWLVACIEPSHYLNQFWYIVNWNPRDNLQQNLNENTKILFFYNSLKMSAKWWPLKIAFENAFFKMAAILSWPECVTIHTTAKQPVMWSHLWQLQTSHLHHRRIL